MKRESKRDPAPGKGSSHYPSFETVQKWLDNIGVDSEVFKRSWKWQKILVEGNKIESRVVKKTLSKKNLSSELFRQITDYLGQEDAPERSNLIFVFGSKSLLRIDKASELYKQGLAPKIFITGGHPHYEKGESEAETFKKYAIEKGIPKEDILIDPKSITIADNVRRSLNLFDKWKLYYSKMILVTSWFAMRRSWAFMMKYVPTECNLYRVSSDVSPDGDFTKDGWWKNENGIKVIFNEYVKMKIGAELNTN